MVFTCLQMSELLLQLTWFENRDPTCFSPKRVYLNDRQKNETNRDKRNMKEQFTILQDKISLLRRTHGVAHDEGSDKKLEYDSNFISNKFCCLCTLSLNFPTCL